MEQIIEFSHLLREKGIPVSIRSSTSACQVLDIIKKDDPGFRDALRAVYVKSPNHLERFEETYNSFFEQSTGEDNEEEDVIHKIGPKQDSQDRAELPRIDCESQATDEYLQFKTENIEYQPPLNEYMPHDSDDLLHRDIETLKFSQPELLALIQELGKKISTIRSRRLRKSTKMNPDIRRTIRKNLQKGGTLLELVKNKPRLKNNNYLLLNDVSGSCDWISNWFFCLVYAAQNSFRRIRVFEFDNRVAETTKALRESDLLDAFTMVRVMRHKNLMVHGTSNMFEAFKAFLEKVDLNRRTTVIILTDCRDWAGPKDNGIPQSAYLIEIMAKSARRVIILNPESRNKWNVVDSCVEDYQEAGAEVHEVRNLQQLARFVSLI